MEAVPSEMAFTNGWLMRSLWNEAISFLSSSTNSPDDRIVLLMRVPPVTKG